MRFTDHTDFPVVSRSLFPCWDPVFQVATQVVALHIPHITVLHVCVEEGGFHVGFVSEVYRLRE